jgi:hypothetical protein
MATPAQKSKVTKVMREKKRGTLKSGSGKRVKSRKQAIAIAMSESGQSRRKSASTGRKTSSRKSAASTRKSSTRKATSRKTTSRKTAARGRKSSKR